MVMDDTRTDTELARLVLAGERGLFEVFMRRYNTTVYRAVRSILRNEAEVEDVMQQAYLAAFEHLDSYRGESKLSTWLVRIAVNEALGKLRKKRPTVEIDEQERASEMSNPEDMNAMRELLTVMETCIDELPKNARIVVMLRDIEEMSTADVASVLEIQEDAVKTRLHRARAQLEARMREKLDAAKGEAFSFHAPRCNRVTAGVMAVIRARP